METATPKSRLAVVYSLPFLLAAALSIVMLATDKNLQTDFGTVTTGYFLHWYVVLVTAVSDIAGAVLLLTLRSRTAVKLGVLGSLVLSVLFVGVIFTYQQVGFASANDFAQYLFGVTYYGGDIRYLYDALLATYLGTFVMGGAGLAVTRTARSPSAPDDAPPSRAD